MWLKQRADRRWELSGVFAAEIGAFLATMIETDDRRQMLADQAAADDTKNTAAAAHKTAAAAHKAAARGTQGRHRGW